MGHIMANPSLMWPPKKYVRHIKKSMASIGTKPRSSLLVQEMVSEKKIKDESSNEYECKKCLYGTHNEWECHSHWFYTGLLLLIVWLEIALALFSNWSFSHLSSACHLSLSCLSPGVLEVSGSSCWTPYSAARWSRRRWSPPPAASSSLRQSATTT